ncbi:MAG: CBS domain-containing protein [Cyanobacteria bacterium SZAS LIN-3]|nr:CBS domain-containing protein [Cyanobacteria bacterium SZAS LIN-3]
MEIALSHNNMDFDSLSAQYALTKLYPACRMVLGHPLTGNVRSFVALNRNYLPLVQVKYIDLAKVSRFYLVDCQNIERLDIAAQKLLKSESGKGLSRPLTIIDHHEVEPHGLLSLATPDSVVEKVGAATTILVEKIIKTGITLSEFDATVLAIGIFEDTGCLTYSATTAKDARCVAFLIEHGADLSVVREYIRPKMELEQVGLFERLLKNTEILEVHGHRFALAQSDEPKYIEGLATITRQILELNNVDGAFTVAHMRDRVHLVGRCDAKAVSVKQVLQEFGGDGHPGAASAVVKGASLKAVMAKLRETIERYAGYQPLAKDLMVSPVRTVRPDIAMDEAGRIMLRYGLDGLVVADEDKVVGIISRRDIDQSTHHRLGHAKVSGFMSKPVITISQDATLGQIQQTMVSEDIGRLPVMDDSGNLVGLVSRQDVLNSLFGVDYARDKQNTGEIVERSFTRRRSKGPSLADPLLQLDADTVWLAREIGRLSNEIGMVSYAVGGFVRDLLLKIPNFDLDFVIEGSAGALADKLVEAHPERFEIVARHDRFQTATLVYYPGEGGKLENRSGQSNGRPHRDVDLSTARIEIYEKPAALPEVEPSKLEHDLLRRDFTINALALCLNPERFGELVDHFEGVQDLELKNIRILHPFSFIEDPTRIVRAARFAGRLNFHLEPKTREQARRAISMGIFEDLGGVRIREELRMILESPTRIRSLNILADLSPRLCYIDAQLDYNLGITRALRRSERLLQRYPVDEPWIVHLGALLSELPIDRVSGVLDRLQLTNKQKEIIESGLDLHRQMPLELRQLKRSEIYDLMHGRPRESLAIAAAIAAIGTDLRRAIKTFLEELADTKLDISGGDLIKLGHSQGPMLGQALRQVMAARLDRRISSRQEQLELAAKYLSRN